MPKTTTEQLAAQIAETMQKADAMAEEILNLTDALNKNYLLDVADPVAAARTFSVLARDASHLAVLFGSRHTMQVQKEALERLKAEHAAKNV